MQNAKSLISITRELLEIEYSLIESEGEISPELEAQLEITKENFPQKIDSYDAIMSRLDATETWAKARIDEMRDLLKRTGRTRESLEYRLSQAMQMLGKDELEGNHAVFYYKEGRGSVEVPDINDLPLEYTRQKITVEADKKAIQAAIKAGIEVPGATIVKAKTLVREGKV